MLPVRSISRLRAGGLHLLLPVSKKALRKPLLFTNGQKESLGWCFGLTNTTAGGVQNMFRQYGKVLMEQQIELERALVFKQFLKQQWIKCKASVFIADSLTLSSGGQSLLHGSFGLFLAFLLPSSASALTYSLDSSKVHYHEQLFSRHLIISAAPSILSWIQALLNWGFLLALWDEFLTILRGAYLMALFFPVIALSPSVLYFNAYSNQWMDLMKWTLEHAGPAFIKWGQWASTRPDLFPEAMCDRLEQLQTSAPAHPGSVSRSIVEAAFQQPIDRIFDEFQEFPVASGSIAQIHRAVISKEGARLTGEAPGTVVAVKVRHPGVGELMHRDFELMQRAARICERIPAIAALRLEESLRQFGGPLKEQLDLSCEANHLKRFNKNFKAWSNVDFPRPIFPLVTKDVLVESFEEGCLISRYVRQQHPYNRVLAKTGVGLFLKMMLHDNFIHADLHPGNIIVRRMNNTGLLEAADPVLAPGVSGWLKRMGLMGSSLGQPKVIILDTGMIVELEKRDKESLLNFFTALTRMDGERLAKAVLSMSEGQTCKNPSAFIQEMKDTFINMDPEYLRLESQTVMKNMIESMRQHQVTLRSAVSTVVVTTLVLEGWSSKLDPEIRIINTLKELLSPEVSEKLMRIWLNS